MRMMKNKIVIAGLVLFGLCFAAVGVSFAELDDGTGPDGTAVLCSRTLAMRCGLGSEDAGDMNKIKECFDKIASDAYGSQLYKQSVNKTRSDAMHECSKIYYELAIKYKADAGDYVDKGDENGNSELKTDKHGKKEQEGKITASNSKNIVKLLDVYSSSVMLDSLEIMFGNIARRDISDEMKNNGEEKTEEPVATAGGEGNE